MRCRFRSLQSDSGLRCCGFIEPQASSRRSDQKLLGLTSSRRSAHGLARSRRQAGKVSSTDTRPSSPVLWADYEATTAQGPSVSSRRMQAGAVPQQLVVADQSGPWWTLASSGEGSATRAHFTRHLSPRRRRNCRSLVSSWFSTSARARAPNADGSDPACTRSHGHSGRVESGHEHARGVTYRVTRAGPRPTRYAGRLRRPSSVPDGGSAPGRGRYRRGRRVIEMSACVKALKNSLWLSAAMPSPVPCTSNLTIRRPAFR